jgi:4-diphosphocytidyl-2-C-methyl-D-erythritol kinase
MYREERLLAPAKVNLCLRVVGRRTDGYHLLDSLMVPISLYDELTVKVGSAARGADPEQSIRVSSDSGNAPGGPTNLAYRAAAMFLTRVKRTVSVATAPLKRIPVGSGLGGGSSDGAAVLLALNRLLGGPLATAELGELGAQIGADVTFFVHGCPARVQGVGERITPLSLPRRLSLVICWDGHSLSTQLVYSRVNVSLTRPAGVSNILEFVSGHGLSPELLVNDLEEAAAQIHPEVLSLKARLMKEGAVGALMTGSGAAVFGVWRDLESARNAAIRLRQLGLWAEPVETLAMSPVVGC